jgi:hypothetical protein
MTSTYQKGRVRLFDPRKPGKMLAPWLAVVVRRAIDYLKGRAEEGAYTKEVVKSVGASARTVQRALEVAEAGGYAEQDFRGHWVTTLRIPNEIAKINAVVGIHGLVLDRASWPITQPGTSPSSPSSQETAMPVGSFGSWEPFENYCRIIAEWAGRRRVEFRWHPSTRRLQVYVTTSAAPIGLAEMFELLGWLQDRCHPADPGNLLFVSQVSINKDLPSIRLDGLNSIRLSAFLNALVSLYNKKGRGLRVEGEMTPRELSFSQMLEIITSFDPRAVEARSQEMMARAIAKLTELIEGIVAGSKRDP